jgi:hypothetical protein
LFGGRPLDPVGAAFLNSVYSGSIDADDTHVGSMLHPGAIVFSAALAVCTNASGAEYLAAVAAGYEAMICIGLSIQPTHFRRGFQSTATCGGFGAAVAAGGSLDLNTLRAILHDIEDAHVQSNIGAVWQLTGEFQLAVFRASHNDYLYELLSSIQEKIRNYRTSTTALPGRADEIVAYCQALLAAIEARNANEAERISRDNCRRTLELRLKMIRTVRLAS